MFALVIVAAIGPAHWTVRSGLGWKADHFFGFLGLTILACINWNRPYFIGPFLAMVGVLLEALQALTPDRHPDFVAALCSAGGAFTAAFLAKLIGLSRSFTSGRFFKG